MTETAMDLVRELAQLAIDDECATHGPGCPLDREDCEIEPPSETHDWYELLTAFVAHARRIVSVERATLAAQVDYWLVQERDTRAHYLALYGHLPLTAPPSESEYEERHRAHYDAMEALRTAREALAVYDREHAHA